MGVHSHNKGFTLIELLVAIILGMLVMSAGYVVFQGSNRATREQNMDNRMQDNARLAMDVLARNFRRAGFLVNFTSYPTGTCPNGNTAVETMCAKLTTLNSTAGPDEVTILGGTLSTGGTVSTGRTLLQSANRGSTTLVLNDVSGIKIGSVIGVGLTYSGLVANVVSNTVTLNTTNPTGATNMDYPGEFLQNGTRSKQNATPVRLVTRTRYRINSANAAHPVLEQTMSGGTPEPVAEDIEDLQIAYGVDRNNNRIIEAGEWTYAPTDNEIDKIRLVRITIVARTANVDPLLRNISQTIPAIEDRDSRDVTDGYRRYILTRIIKTKNLDAIFSL